MVVGTGCTLGIHSSHGHNASTNLTLEPDIEDGPLTGTVDESARSTELVFGGMIAAGLMTVELGASFGVRAVGFESATGGLTMVQPPGDPDGLSNRGFYDAYFVGLSRPLTAIDTMNLGVYGRLQLTGLARLAPGSSATTALEAGAELDLPTGHKRNRIFVRVGLVREGAEYELDMDSMIGSAHGSTSFVGLAAAIGVRLWDN